LPVLAALHVPPPKESRAAAHGQVRRQTKAGKATDKDLSRSKLPVLRKRDDAGVLQPRCKSPCLLLRQMLAVMIHWFPDRKFILLGDGLRRAQSSRGFASHDLAWFCRRHRRHVTLIARFCPDAALYTLPSDRTPRKRGPRRTKGLRLPSPQESVAAAGKLRETNLPWYGQGRRDVQILSACGAWYRCRGSGRGAVVPIRWVYGRETKREPKATSTAPTRRCRANKSSHGSPNAGALRRRSRKCGRIWASTRRVNDAGGRCCARVRACWDFLRSSA
jgi:hypothetical protein